MANTDAPFRLVLFEPVDEPHPVRDLMVRVTGDHPTDVMQWVARAPVVWPRGLTAEQSQAILDGLYELEVAAEARHVENLPVIGPPRTIHDAACLEHGLRVAGLRKEPTHWVPWEKVELVCAGIIQTEPEQISSVEPPNLKTALVNSVNLLRGRRAPEPRRDRAEAVPRDSVRELLIVRKDPRLTLRVVETGMTYAYLGSRLKLNAAENFPTFLDDIRRFSKTAYITRSTELILEKKDLDEATFASTQALLDYALMQLLWSWYRNDRDRTTRTLTDEDDR